MGIPSLVPFASPPPSPPPFYYLGSGFMKSTSIDLPQKVFRDRPKRASKKKRNVPPLARTVRRDLQWLHDIAVFWTGGDIQSLRNAKRLLNERAKASSIPSPIVYLIATHLENRAPGIYLVDQTAFATAVRLDKLHLTRAAYKLKRVRDPDPDFADWSAHTLKRIHTLGQLLAASQVVATSPKDALILEESSLWLAGTQPIDGAENRTKEGAGKGFANGWQTGRANCQRLATENIPRPSNACTTAELKRVVACQTPGCFAAAAALAHRRQTIQNGRFRTVASAAFALREVPVNLLAQLRHLDAPLGPLPPDASHPAVVAGLRELLLTGSPWDVEAYLSCVPLLLAETRRIHREPIRRMAWFLQELAGARAPYAKMCKRGRRRRTYNKAVGNHLANRIAPWLGVKKHAVPATVAGCLGLVFGHVNGSPKAWTRFPPLTENPEAKSFVRVVPDAAIHNAWVESLLTLFARVVGCVGSDQAEPLALGFAAWMDVCRRKIAPGKHGSDGLAFAVQSLHDALYEDGHNNQSWGRFLTGLCDDADDIFWMPHSDRSTARARFNDGYLRAISLIVGHAGRKPVWDWMHRKLKHFNDTGRHTIAKALETSLMTVGASLPQHLELMHRLDVPPALWDHNIFVLKILPRDLAVPFVTQVNAMQGRLGLSFDKADELWKCIDWFRIQFLRQPIKECYGAFRSYLAPLETLLARELKQHPGLDLEHLFDGLALFRLWEVTNDNWDAYWRRLLPRIREDRDPTMLWFGVEDFDVLVGLAGGSLDRLIFLLEVNEQSTLEITERVFSGWRSIFRVAGAETLCAFLVMAGVCKKRWRRLAALLEKTKALSRFMGPTAFAERMRAISGTLRLPDEEFLGHIRADQGLNPVHPEIAKTRARPTALARELSALRKSGRAPGRQVKLAAWLADPDALNAETGARVEKILNRILPAVGFDWIEREFDREFNSLFQRATEIDPTDWQNTIQLMSSANGNRRMLRAYLRRMRTSDDPLAPLTDWAPNRDFLERLRPCGNVEAWVAHHERQLPTRKNGTWTAYTEEDPMKILHMGNLFGTCLSVNGINAHSTIANMLEVNKRVLYVKDACGTIVGRRLLVLTRDGELLPFQSYGVGGEDNRAHYKPWVKIGLDLLTMDLSLRTGFAIADVERFNEEREEDVKKLHLAAEWYFDWAEPLDPWIPDYFQKPATELRQRVHHEASKDRLSAETLRLALVLGMPASEDWKLGCQSRFTGGKFT